MFCDALGEMVRFDLPVSFVARDWCRAGGAAA